MNYQVRQMPDRRLDIGWLLVLGLGFLFLAALAPILRALPDPIPRDLRVLIVIVCNLPGLALMFLPGRLRVGPRAANAAKVLFAGFIGALIGYLLDSTGLIHLPRVQIIW